MHVWHCICITVGHFGV